MIRSSVLYLFIDVRNPSLFVTNITSTPLVGLGSPFRMYHIIKLLCYLFRWKCLVCPPCSKLVARAHIQTSIRSQENTQALPYTHIGSAIITKSTKDCPKIHMTT